MDRQTPHDEKTERAALGAMLCAGEVARIGCELLEPESFFIPWHRDVFRAIAAIVSDNGTPDEILVNDWLRTQGLYTGIFEDDAVGRLTVGTFEVTAIEAYAEILKRQQTLRDAAQTAQRIQAAVDAGDVERVNELTGTRDIPRNAGFRPFVELFDADVFDSPPRISAGYPMLDSELGGGYPIGSLVFLVGGTSDGKSTFLRNMLLQSAKAALLTLEDSELQARQKLTALTAGLPWSLVENYQRNEDDGGPNAIQREYIGKAREYLKTLDLYIGECARLTDIEREVKRLAEKGVQLFFIDQSSWIDPGPTTAMYDKAVAVGRGLKRIAREANVVIVTAIQLNRTGQKARASADPLDPENEPQLWHLRQAGEEDADVVLIIKSVDRQWEPYTAIIGIDKNRHGPRYRRCKFTWEPASGAIQEYVPAIPTSVGDSE